MKKLFIYISILICLPLVIEAQTDYAGPDKTTCQGGGVAIGNASPGNVCYTWDASLSLTPDDKSGYMEAQQNLPHTLS